MDVATRFDGVAKAVVSCTMRAFWFVAAAMLFVLPARAEALRLTPGGGPAVVQGILIGPGGASYTTKVTAGQRVRVALRSSNPDLVIGIEDAGPRVILPPGPGQTSYSGVATRTGMFRITVQFARGAPMPAARYALSVELLPREGGGDSGGGGEGGRPPRPEPPSGDSLYRVVGLTGSQTLNVRSGPGEGYRVLAELSPGTGRLQLGGCRRAGATQWCEIATTRGIPVRGWVNSRYLAEDRR